MNQGADPTGDFFAAASRKAAQPSRPAPGDSIEGVVERIAYGGEGVVRAGDFVLFVPWTAPGDRIRATVIERHPRWARARLDEVVEGGPDRAAPGCPVYGICGGCRLQHLTEEAQHSAKARAVEDALCRIAGIRPPGGVACEPVARPWAYRQRAVLTWRRDHQGLRVGYHAAADPAGLVAIGRCPILAEEGNTMLAALVRALDTALAELAPEDEATTGPIEGRLAIRVLPSGGLQAGLFAPDEELAHGLAQACGRAAGNQVTWGRWTPRDPRLELARGAPRLAVRLSYRGLSLRVGFDSFLQVDLDAAERLYDAILDTLEADAGGRVIDGYAGVGVITCALAARGVRVTAVESHAGAASDLRANTAAVGGSVHVLELPAERVDWRRPRPDAVVLNPPRGGCPPSALASIARSSARRLVYAACDPTTLARDVRRLGPAWRLDAVHAFDLFPQTAHVETVARLSRGEAA